MKKQNTIIKNYYWNLNGDVLEIYVIDTNNNEFILAEISDCENMTCSELDELTEEIIFEHNFILDEKEQETGITKEVYSETMNKTQGAK